MLDYMCLNILSPMLSASLNASQIISFFFFFFFAVLSSIDKSAALKCKAVISFSDRCT